MKEFQKNLGLNKNLINAINDLKLTLEPISADTLEVYYDIEDIKRNLICCEFALKNKIEAEEKIEEEVMENLKFELGLSSYELTKIFINSIVTNPEMNQEIMDGIKKAFEEEDYYHMSNYRVAVKGNNLLEKFYQIDQQDGCCGSKDIETEIHGFIFKIGFNYGH